MHTQVGILGGGPAGLLLSHLLALEGIDSVVLDARSRESIETTIRAGVLEDHVAQLLRDTGVGDRMTQEGSVHHGIELRWSGRHHRIDFEELTGGRSITLYGQHEVVKDLNTARVEAGGKIVWEAQAVEIDGFETDRSTVRFRTGPFTDEVRLQRSGEFEELTCDVVAGCDGYWGPPARRSRVSVRTEFERIYPFAWFGILVEAPPSSDELIYALHDRGFSLISTRSPTLQRMYLQVEPDDSVDNWPDERIWEELHARVETVSGAGLVEGAIIDKSIVGMRSFVSSTMQHGNLYLAGDAAHIVPPTGAKGMNLAVADVRVPHPRARAEVPHRLDGHPRPLQRHLPAARVEGAALLVVDDLDAAPPPRRRPVPARAPAGRARLRHGLDRRRDLARRELRRPAPRAAVARGPRQPGLGRRVGRRLEVLEDRLLGAGLRAGAELVLVARAAVVRRVAQA